MNRSAPPRPRARRAPKETLSTLARASRSGLITVADAAEALGVSSASAASSLAALARRGWLERARRGLYLVVPLEATGDGATVEDPWVLAQVLFAPCYVAGWSAAEHWGLTEQVFHSTFIASTASVRARSQHVLGLDFRLAKIPPARLSAGTLVWHGRECIPVSDPGGTIADGLASPSWVGGVRHLARMLTAYRADASWDPGELVARLETIGSGAAFKRLGFLVETLGLDAPTVVGAALDHRSAGVVRLDPDVPGKGRLTKRWGLWVNARVDGQEDLG